MPDLQNLEDKNEDVQGLVQTIPPTILLWGNTVFLVILLALLFLGWVIKYPDLLRSRITITTEAPPVPVIANQSGELIDLRVQEGSSVREGEVVAIINSTAESADVLALIAILDTIQIVEIEKLVENQMTWPENLDLGSMNGDYADFLSAYHDYWTFINLSPLTQQIRNEKAKLLEQEVYLKKLERQVEIYNEEISLVSRDFDRNQALLKKGAITEKNLEDVEFRLLEVKRQYQGTLLNISEVKINIVEGQRLIDGYEVQIMDRTQSLKLAMFSSFKRLQSSVDAWDRNYLLRAPITGRISLFDYWSENQFISQFDEVFTVVAEQEGDRIGKVLLPVRNSGKLAVGQKVIIKLDDYQFQEYGTIVGWVSEVSAVPRGSQYAVKIDIPNDLVTSYGRPIAFRNEMLGSVEIITEDLSLLERIMHEVIRKLNPDRGPTPSMELKENVSFILENTESN